MVAGRTVGQTPAVRRPRLHAGSGRARSSHPLRVTRRAAAFGEPRARKVFLPHIARQLQQDVDVSRRVLARRSTSADGSRGLQQTSHTGPDEGLPRRFVRRQGDTERQGMSVELPATLISRTGIAQRISQVNWTMIMSSRGWQALHGLAGQPATLSTGIRHGPGGARTRQLRLQARRSRRTGRSPACPRLCSPFCSPGGPFRCYSPPAGTRSTGLSCGNSRAGSQHPGVYLPALQEVRGHFSQCDRICH